MDFKLIAFTYLETEMYMPSAHMLFAYFILIVT